MLKNIKFILLALICIASFRCDACQNCLNKLVDLGKNHDTKSEHPNVYFYEMGFQEALRQASIIIYFNHKSSKEILEDLADG